MPSRKKCTLAKPWKRAPICSWAYSAKGLFRGNGQNHAQLASSHFSHAPTTKSPLRSQKLPCRITLLGTGRTDYHKPVKQCSGFLIIFRGAVVGATEVSEEWVRHLPEITGRACQERLPGITYPEAYGGGKSSPLAGLYPAQTLLITLYNRMGNSRCARDAMDSGVALSQFRISATYRLGLIERKSKERLRRHIWDYVHE